MKTIGDYYSTICNCDRVIRDTEIIMKEIDSEGKSPTYLTLQQCVAYAKNYKQLLICQPYFSRRYSIAMR